MNENAVFFFSRDGKQNTEFKPNNWHVNFYISKKNTKQIRKIRKKLLVFFFAHNLNSLFCADVILVIRALKSLIKVKN